MSKKEIVLDYLMENKDVIYRIALFHVKNEADAYDVVSEASIKAITKCNALKKPEAIKSWFYRILIRCIYDSTNRKKRFLPINEEAQISLDSDTFTDKLSFLEIIDHLPPKYQTVIVLRFYENLTFKEMAKILRLPQSTVKSRVNKAIELLRKEVHEDV